MVMGASYLNMSVETALLRNEDTATSSLDVVRVGRINHLDHHRHLLASRPQDLLLEKLSDGLEVTSPT
jgi:hypothetical protein